MKIMLATMQFDRGCFQGTERYLSILCEGLTRRGHEAVVLAGDPERHGPSVAAGALVQMEPRTLRLPTGGWMAVMGTPPQRLIPLLEAERPDIVHVANPAHIGVGLMLAAQQLGLPVVLTIMDYWWWCPKHTLRHSLRGVCDGRVPWHECLLCISAERDAGPHRLHRVPGLRRTLLPVLHLTRWTLSGTPPAESLRWIRRRRILHDCLRSAAAIICPSQAAERRIAALAEPERIHRVPYGLEPRWLEAGQAARAARALTRTARSPEQLRIGYAGALAPHKGVHVLLEAIARLGWRRTRVRIAGGGKDARYWSRLAALAAGLNVEFLGPLPSDQMPEFLCGLDWLVFPSLWPENLPIVVLEALACGTPVLASRVEGVAEMVPQAWQFEPGSPSDLAALLERCVSLPLQAIETPGAVSTADEMVSRTLGVYGKVRAGSLAISPSGVGAGPAGS
jgi:glycosyltransferase involved in cell wall biosynthesis